MDIMNKAEELIGKLKGDSDLMSKFTNDPVAAVKELIGKDLPIDDAKAGEIANMIKTKLDVDSLKDKASGLLGGFLKK